MTPGVTLLPRTLVIGANCAWNIVNFRKPIVEALVANGWRVVAAAPPDGHEARVAELGAEYVPIDMKPGSASPWQDIRLFFAYLSLFRQSRPCAFLGFTIKPNIYGSMAARLLGIRTINNISGLGTAFIRPGLLSRVVSGLYRLALARSSKVFFQNRHDRDLFIRQGLVRTAQAQVIPGSGIDPSHFVPAPIRDLGNGPFRFLFIGRLLRDKGLVEYADAARTLRSVWPEVEFGILGSAGSDNPTAVPISEVKRWQREGIVNWFGETDDVRPFLAQADCIVLPSYREGLPRSLLEAAASARPMIATDVPGCNDVVEPGVTGMLCGARSATSLAAVMDQMLRVSRDERTAMGDRARSKVEREFDQSLVVKAYLEALE